jgi:3-methyladenine DNA glycosylase Tag
VRAVPSATTTPCLVGSTISYAFMQATGMVNDRLVTCFRYSAIGCIK